MKWATFYNVSGGIYAVRIRKMNLVQQLTIDYGNDWNKHFTIKRIEVKQ